MSSECREAFEEWFSVRGGIAQPMYYYREYLYSAWQAAWNHRAQVKGEMVEVMAKAYAPELWAHEDDSAGFMDKAHALTVESAHARAAVIKRMKAAIAVMKGQG